MNHNIRIAFFGTTRYNRNAFCNANSMYDFDIRFFEERMTAHNAQLAAGCTVVCAGSNDDISSETINVLSHNGIRLIALRTPGFGNVNMAAAKNAGMEICVTDEYCADSTAEYTLALLLTLTRKIHRAYCRVREGDISGNNLAGYTLHGKTAGIIGTGRIGRRFASLLRGFGTRVLAYDPDPDYEAAAKYNFKYVSFPELLRHSDIVTLHCPLTAASVMLLDREAFATLKEGAVLINTCRSGLIDMQALLDAVRSGRIGGAALDIYEEENMFFPTTGTCCSMNDRLLEELIKENNVLVTFKQGIQTRECFEKTAGSVLHNIACFAEDLPRDPANFICTACDGSRNCPGKLPFIKCTPPELAVSPDKQQEKV